MTRKEIDLMWSTVAAEQRAARAQGEVYRDMLQSKTIPDQRKEMFLFYCRQTQLDRGAKLRLHILRLMSDLDIVLIFDQIHLGYENANDSVKAEIRLRLSPGGAPAAGDDQSNLKESEL